MSANTHYKPQKTLTQLEDEPESGFFGVTYTEVVGALKKSIVVALIIAVVVSIVMYWVLAAILGMLIGVFYFWKQIKYASAQRADKPLFYHKHISTYRTNQFIQPKARMQRERNSDSGRKKH